MLNTNEFLNFSKNVISFLFEWRFLFLNERL